MFSVQLLDFEDIRLLIQHDRLVCDSCSSGQRFACGFLQIRPHDRHPCRPANGSRCRARRGLAPPSKCALPGTHRVGGGIAPAVLPHHRAYGSVPRRFMSMLLLLLPCLLSYRRPVLPHGFRPLLRTLGPLARHLLKTFRTSVQLL
jgi:hypothetical protein